MCLSSAEAGSAIIRVRGKTNKAKYEFLRSYYTIWNQITKTRSRVIIDTHAGSGIVELKGDKNLFNKSNIQLIYGSPLLAILKTLKISKNLTIILNESDLERFNELKKYTKELMTNGIRIFKKELKEFRYKSLETKRQRKLKKKQEWIFPETPNAKPPIGYIEVRDFTKAEIILYKKKIEEIIDEILLKYLRKSDKNEEPIALFFVDPCGIVSWFEVIEKICKRSNKKEGTELILNWSWEAINRNLNSPSKNSVLNKVYGTPINRIDEEFREIIKMNQFLEKYINQLREYFKYVVRIGVPKDRKIKPKLSQYKKYFLLLCTNNKSALSLAGHKAEKIKDRMRGNFLDMKKFIRASEKVDK